MTYYLMCMFQGIILIESVYTRQGWKALYWFAAMLLTLAVKKM